MTKYHDILDLLILHNSFRLALVPYHILYGFNSTNIKDEAWIIFTPTPKPVIWEFSGFSMKALSYENDLVKCINLVQDQNALQALQQNSRIIERDFTHFCEKMMNDQYISQNSVQLLLKNKDFVDISIKWNESKSLPTNDFLPFSNLNAALTIRDVHED